MSDPVNLILLTGHAIWNGQGDPYADESWTLQEFQRGEPRCYIEHIRRAVELGAADPLALLIFSGGQTRREAGPRSEAESYRELAAHFTWFGHPLVSARCQLEEYARDSYENLLFGLCRFHQCRGRFPTYVSVAGWAFKESRFHTYREAIGWPRERFSYIGINDPPDRDNAVRGEAATTQSEAKRAVRDPFQRGHPYGDVILELRPPPVEPSY